MLILIYRFPGFCPLVSSLPCNHLEEVVKAVCFAINVLQMYCYYKCFVALLHGAIGKSAVCDCGIS